MRSVAVLLVVGSSACGDSGHAVTEVEPETLEISAERGASLEVLDWIGTGRTLVFLAGGGHTAHESDDFASLSRGQRR